MFAFIAVSSLALVVAYCTSWAVYALAFHPLAAVPGPKICAISRLPYWYYLFKGDDAQWIKTLHDRYGPVVRFGPTDLSYTAAQAWDDVYGPRVQEKALEFFVQPINGVSSMLILKSEHHARVRKLFAPAFSDRAMRQQEPLLRRYADLLMRRIGEMCDGGKTPVDLVRLFNFTTFDIMGEFCFGESLGMLENNEMNSWVSDIFGMLRMMPVVTFINYYPLLQTLFRNFEPQSVKESRLAHLRHSEIRVDRRLERGSMKPDVWNLVTGAKQGQGLTIPEMHVNAELLMFAGSETTATLLSGCIYLLLTNRDKLDTLLAELRDTFATTNGLSLESLAESKYLNAVLRESLRAYPAFPGGSPRVVPKRGQRILGKWIPEGTRISAHHLATFRSEENFTNADRFVPERWLKDPAYAGDALSAHKPFSTGPRDCLGRNMAWAEMRMILAVLLLSFDLELCEESRGWLGQKSFSMWIKGPLMVRAKPVA